MGKDYGDAAEMHVGVCAGKDYDEYGARSAL